MQQRGHTDTSYVGSFDPHRKSILGRLIDRAEYGAGRGKPTYFYRLNTAGLSILEALLDTIGRQEDTLRTHAGKTR